MTAPVVAGSAVGGETSNTNSHSITLPSHSIGQDLYVFFAMEATSNGLSNSDGFSELLDVNINTGGSDEDNVGVFYKRATSASETLTINSATSERSTHISVVVTGGADPASSAPEISSGATGTDDMPDPDQVSMSGGADDYLFVAFMVDDRDQDVTAFPSTHADNQTSYLHASACCVAIATRAGSAESSDNPDPFTIAGNQGWGAWTIGIYPAGGGGITGTLAKTLDAVAASSASTLDLSGQGSVTSADVALGSAASLDLTGALVESLEDASPQAVGALAVSGALSAMLEQATFTSDSSLALSAQLSAGLDDATFSGLSELDLAGALSVSADAVQVATSASLDVSSAASVVLDDAMVQALGEHAGIHGSLSKVLGGASASAEGSLDVAASASTSLEPVDLTSQAALALSAQLSQAGEDVSLTASGNTGKNGSASVVLGDVVIISVGEIDLSATLDLSLDDGALAAAGEVTLVGALSLSLGDASIAASGVLGAPVFGSADVALDDASAAATSLLDLEATGAIGLSDLVASTSSALALSSSLAEVLDAVTLSSEAGGPVQIVRERDAAGTFDRAREAVGSADLR